MSNKKFTKDDLKVGYVVKHRNGKLAMLMPGPKGNMIAIDKSDGYTTFEKLTSDMKVGGFEELDLMEVYGYSLFNFKSMRIETNDRKLLWKREEKTCDSCAHKVVCTHVGTCEHYLEKN